VLESSAASREARPPPTEDGGTAGEGMVSPMGRNEHGLREPHEV